MSIVSIMRQRRSSPGTRWRELPQTHDGNCSLAAEKFEPNTLPTACLLMATFHKQFTRSLFCKQPTGLPPKEMMCLCKSDTDMLCNSTWGDCAIARKAGLRAPHCCRSLTCAGRACCWSFLCTSSVGTDGPPSENTRQALLGSKSTQTGPRHVGHLAWLSVLKLSASERSQHREQYVTLQAHGNFILWLTG